MPRDDLTLSLLILAILALIGCAIFVVLRYKQSQNEQKIARMAAEHDWTAAVIREPFAWGLHLSSARWELEAISRSSGKETAPGSSDTSMSTVWQTNAPGSTLLIGPRTTQADLGTLGNALIRQALQMAFGANSRDLNEVQLGSETFRKKYILIAQNPDEAQIFLNPEIESALTNWKGPPVLIQRTSKGLSIELRGVQLKDPKNLLALVELGELMISTNR